VGDADGCVCVLRRLWGSQELGSGPEGMSVCLSVCGAGMVGGL
jgi:hypothetical protein